jgi:predicted nucleotidyltransferase
MSPPNPQLPQHLTAGLAEIAESLNRRGIPYALIGALASGYHGRPRHTQDVDILLAVPQLALPPLLDELRDKGFDLDVETTIRAWNQGHMAVLHFRGVQIDWLKPVLPVFQHVVDRAEEQVLYGTRIRIAAPEGLIVLKLLAFRPQDQIDIQNLLAANQGELDLDFVRSECESVIPPENERLGWLEHAIATSYDTTNGQAHG